ncbi:MAG: hypothetical protein WCQ53_02510 [bacterium]
MNSRISNITITTFLFFSCFSLPTFAQSVTRKQCSEIPANFKSVKLQISKTAETQGGYVKLISGATIKIESFSQWCNMAVGEATVFDSIEKIPDHCSFYMGEKATPNGLFYDCGCHKSDGGLACYKS